MNSELEYKFESECVSKVAEFLDIIRETKSEVECSLIMCDDSIIDIYSSWKQLEIIREMQEKFMDHFGFNVPY